MPADKSKARKAASPSAADVAAPKKRTKAETSGLAQALEATLDDAELDLDAHTVKAGTEARVIKLDTSTEASIKAKVVSKSSAKKKAKRSRQPEVAPGVIYLGHIPFGFFEKQMQEYFSQFGTVTRLRLSRSAKTNRSRGFAFIEFKDADVAEIVAETMNNYLLFDRILKCEVVDPSKVHAKLFQQPHHINRRKAATLEHNKDRTDEQAEKRAKRAVARSKKNAQKLKNLGIDYEPPAMV